MGKKGGDDGAAAQARADEQARQERIRQGTSQIDDIFNKNFTDDFYGGRKQAYIDYAQPQLDQQFKDAQKQLTFSLARGGNLDSSTRADQEATLGRLYGQNEQQLQDQALSQINQTKTNVANARDDLIGSLNATGDAAGAANSALSRAQVLTQPDAYSPLGDLFASFTSGLGTQAALERAAAYSGGAITPRYNTGLFSPSGAVKVT